MASHKNNASVTMRVWMIAVCVFMVVVLGVTIMCLAMVLQLKGELAALQLEVTGIKSGMDRSGGAVTDQTDMGRNRTHIDQDENHTEMASRVTVVTPRRGCGVSATEYRGRCYTFTPCSCSPDFARQQCAKQDGRLAQIWSHEHNTFVRKQLPGRMIYIGANDREKEGEWVWESGRLLNESYSNWGPGEPNNSGKGKGEHCSQLRPSQVWNDVVCSDNITLAGYVCELRY